MKFKAESKCVSSLFKGKVGLLIYLHVIHKHELMPLCISLFTLVGLEILIALVNCTKNVHTPKSVDQLLSDVILTHSDQHLTDNQEYIKVKILSGHKIHH